MLQTLLRPLARARYAHVIGGQGFRAADAPVVGGGIDAGRVLLLGSGVSSGWGLRTHGLALTGQLSTQIRRRTARDYAVELIGDEAMNLASALAWLGDAGSERWDAVVVAVGINDATRLTPVARWRSDMAALLTRLEDVLAPEIPLLIAGIPPLQSIAPLRGLLAATTARHAIALNAVTAAVIAEQDGRARYVELPGKATEEKRPWGSPAAYTPWAETLAEQLSPTLTTATAGCTSSRAALQPHVRAAMDDVYADNPTQLRSIATQAQHDFGAALVQINLLDGDRMWVAANSNAAATTSLPRALTYCDVTLEQGELQVRNARRDRRFAHNPLIEVTGLSSYAGAAIYSAGGQPIGTVCLFGGSVSSGVDMTALRAVAREVEQVLPASTDPVSQQPSDEPAGFDDPDAVGTIPPEATGTGRVVQYAQQQTFFRREARRFEARSRAGRPFPRTHERVTVIGPNPIRVLVVGGDYSVGLGATTRDETIDGHLGRLLHEHTGRGVVVENRSKLGVRLEDLNASLGRIGAYTFDLVVWSPTFAEATRHLRTWTWHEHVACLLRQVDATSDSAVILLGIPQLLGVQPLATMARVRASKINRAIRTAADEAHRTCFVEPPALPLRGVTKLPAAPVYSAAAARMLPAALQLLAAPSRDRPRAGNADSELLGAARSARSAVVPAL